MESFKEQIAALFKFMSNLYGNHKLKKGCLYIKHPKTNELIIYAKDKELNKKLLSVIKTIHEERI